MEQETARRSLRPLATAGAVALVTTGLLVLAVARGWLGPDVGRGDHFCEAARDGWIAQPANTLSNLGFVVAGLVIAWRSGRPDRLGDVLSRTPGLATAYACVVVALGPASAAMHATQSERGGDLDLLSMYLLAAFAVAYAAMRWVRQGPLFLAQVGLLLLAACELVGRYGGRVPVVDHAGNAAFGVLLVVAVALEVALWRRAGRTPGPPRTRLWWGAASVGTLVVSFTIWTLTRERWCNPTSWLQGHAVWHVLDAVAAALLFELWASERRTADGNLWKSASRPRDGFRPKSRW